jgi:hypothetical protein
VVKWPANSVLGLKMRGDANENAAAIKGDVYVEYHIQ